MKPLVRPDRSTAAPRMQLRGDLHTIDLGTDHIKIENLNKGPPYCLSCTVCVGGLLLAPKLEGPFESVLEVSSREHNYALVIPVLFLRSSIINQDYEQESRTVEGLCHIRMPGPKSDRAAPSGRTPRFTGAALPHWVLSE